MHLSRAKRKRWRFLFLFLFMASFFIFLFSYFRILERAGEKNSSIEELRQQEKIKIPSMYDDGKPTADDNEKTMDFSNLWEINKNIVAYLDIPGTKISYPIFHAKEDSYYLNHNMYGREANSGELFLENYNADDFQDPVTIIYGHNMQDGTYFGDLQELYSNTEGFAENQEIHLFLPGRNITYRVKAAVPFSPAHIFYYYDFSQRWIFEAFMEDIYGVRSMIANFSEDAQPYGEKPLLILSTCLDGDHNSRYLILAQQEK